MTDGLAQLCFMLNSKEPENSPLYVKNIEGFYYGYQDPAKCYERFGWEPNEFQFALNPSKEHLELLDRLYIPKYGDE